VILSAPALSGVTDTVISGPFLLAGLLAIAAGVVSFASPCVVPLVPGYLSYLAGLVGADTAGATPSGTAAGGAAPVTTSRVRWRAVGATGLFVAGFSLVFLAESALVLGVYTTFIRNQEVLTRISGVIAIVMGLVLAGAVPLLQREWRFHLRPSSRIWGAPVLGAAFGTGWLACTSPTLAGIVALSSATEWNGNAVRGLALVLLYCAGLGVPFILLAIGFGWAGTALAFLRRHARGIQLGGAAVLVLIGVLMVTGAWGAVLSRLQGAAVLL
jgi:cytochrome c-type biogenesis protein